MFTNFNFCFSSFNFFLSIFNLLFSAIYCSSSTRVDFLNLGVDIVGWSEVPGSIKVHSMNEPSSKYLWDSNVDQRAASVVRVGEVACPHPPAVGLALEVECSAATPFP